MNQSQIHLALTHMPVILTLTGLVVLSVSLFIRNIVVTKVAFYMLIAAAVFVLPVFFSGEGAEETVEHLAGVSESMIQKHENVANVSFYIVIATGILAGAGLLRLARRSWLSPARYLVLFVALFSSALMIWTAHLGGQIRHSEIAQSVIQNKTDEQEHDDD